MTALYANRFINKPHETYKTETKTKNPQNLLNGTYHAKNPYSVLGSQISRQSAHEGGKVVNHTL